MKGYPKELLLKMYRTMVRIRLFEEKLAEGVLAGEIGTPCHLYVGQEAVATGVCVNLEKKDIVFGNHRSHGHYLAKGGGMNSLMAEIYGKVTGCSRGRGGSMHLIAPEVGFMGAQPLVAGTIPIATGAALASQIRKDGRITTSFFGDGAVEEGVFHEALNFAALKKLPIIFVCENNLYSSHLHLRERRPLDNIYEHGVVHRIPSFRVDGQNILEVYEAARQAVSLARRGKGPVLFEALTYRFHGHVGKIDNVSDQHVKDIRDPKEIKNWKTKDPIRIFETHLRKGMHVTQRKLETIWGSVEREVERAYYFAQKSPYPRGNEFKKYVFKD